MDRRFEHYKEQYYFELTRKGQLAGSMSIPIGFMTAIFTACAYFGLNLNLIMQHWTFWAFLALFSVALIFIIRAAYHLFKAFVGLKYGYNPSPDKLYEYELKYKNHPDLDDKFFLGIKKSFINTTTKNRINNNARANRLYKTNVNTIVAIILIIIAAIPFFIGKNISDFQNRSQTKIQTIMVPDEEKNLQPSESEDLPSDPESTDFPTDEWVNESLDIDIPKESGDTKHPKQDSDSMEQSNQ